jgi:hypothetical protein
LSNVINKLSARSSQFINYRDSKLTRILQKAISGNASTAIICTITPNNYQETLSTLLFGQKAKHVKTTYKLNETTKEMELDECKKLI